MKGIRQSGKTHSIRLFAESNYEVIIYLNFWDKPDLIDVFEGELDTDTIIRELSVKMPMPEVNYPPPAHAEVGASRSEILTSLFYPAMPVAPTR